MIESISAITLATHNMSRAVRCYAGPRVAVAWRRGEYSPPSAPPRSRSEWCGRTSAIDAKNVVRYFAEPNRSQKRKTLHLRA